MKKARCWFSEEETYHEAQCIYVSGRGGAYAVLAGEIDLCADEPSKRYFNPRLDIAASPFVSGVVIDHLSGNIGIDEFVPNSRPIFESQAVSIAVRVCRIHPAKLYPVPVEEDEIFHKVVTRREVSDSTTFLVRFWTLRELC